MTVIELVSHLKDLGIGLSVVDQRLVFDAPRGAMNAELRDQLVQNKQQLISLLNTTSPSAAEAAPPTPSNRQPILQASPEQERIWALSQLLPSSAVYNLPLVFQMSGPLRLDNFAKAVDTVCQRHEILRTRFTTTKESVSQVIEDAPLSCLTLDDLTDLSSTEQHERKSEIIDKMVGQPFDMTSGPLVRTHLIKLSNTDSIFVLVMHHIISDGWSFNVYLEELQTAYNHTGTEEPELQQLPFQYADYSTWKHELNKSARVKRQLEYWSNKLHGDLPTLELPVTQQKTYKNLKSNRTTREFSSELSQKVRQLATEHGIPISTVLLALFKILLYSRSKQTDIMVCVPVIGRNTRGADKLIGCFSDIVLLRTNLNDTKSFDDFVARVRKTTSEAMDNCNVPMQLVMQQSETLTRLPIRVMFNHAGQNQYALNLNRLEVTNTPVHCGEATFDLAMLTTETDSLISISLDYKNSLFDELAIDHLLDDYETLASRLCSNSTDDIRTVVQEVVPPEINITGVAGRAKSGNPPQAKHQYLAPQTSTERKLVRIWESVFNLKPIGTNDHFFRLGGYSWLSFVVLAEIEKTFDIKLPIATFETHQTVRELASHIDDFKVNAAASSSKQHVPADTKQWRTFGPGGPGNYIFYSDISQDQTTGKIEIETRAQRFHTEYSTTTTMEDMAKRCIEEMKLVQPEGPYNLVGQVCGANMAIEVGRLLIEAGEQVPFLALFDRQPQLLAKSVWHRYLQHGLTMLCSGNIVHLWHRMTPAIRHQIRRLSSKLTRNRTSSDASPSTNVDATKPAEKFSYTVVQSNYLPKPYPGRFVMFLSEEFANTPEGKTSLHAAKSLANERLEVVVLPGKKQPGILDEEYLPQFIDALDS